MNLKSITLPELMVRLPAVSVPTVLMSGPGASRPLEDKTMPPTLPFPPRTALFTVTVLRILPGLSTSNVPALTVVGPV